MVQEIRHPLPYQQRINLPNRDVPRNDIPLASADGAHLGREGLSFSYHGKRADDGSPNANVNVNLQGKITISTVSEREKVDPDEVRKDALAILDNRTFMAGERTRLTAEGLNADTIATMLRRSLGVSPSPTLQPK